VLAWHNYNPFCRSIMHIYPFLHAPDGLVAFIYSLFSRKTFLFFFCFHVLKKLGVMMLLDACILTGDGSLEHVAEFGKEAVVPFQQEQVQLPADWNAFHIHLHEQCPPPACWRHQGASEERLDWGPIRVYLVPAHHPSVLKVLLINVDDVHKETN